jgi:ATP-dependent Lhr-like helicase
VGDRFALAGRVWEVEELDIARKLIYVRSVQGKMEVSWLGDYGEIHTRIFERMKQVLEEDTVYPYLKENARKRLEVARHLARNTGMLEHSLVHLGGYSWCLFPWLGTRSFRTLRRFLQRNAAAFHINGLEYESGYLTFHLEGGNDYGLVRAMADAVAGGLDCETLLSPGERPVCEKYDPCLPAELLRYAYARDRLRADEVLTRIEQWLGEY